MVAQFLGLRTRFYANLVKRGPWHVIGAVLALCYGLGLAVAGSVGLVAMRAADAETARAVVVSIGSLLTLAGFVVPLFFGVDDAFDPRRFSLFGIPTGRLAAGLTVAALAGIPSVCMAVVAVAQVVTWTRGPVPVLLALLGAPLILGTWTLASRVSTSVGAFLLASRRARDLTAVVGALLILAMIPALIALGEVDWAASGTEILSGTATVLGWTPLGAAWSAPADAAAGQPGAALLKLVVAAATLGALWLAWRALVERMLVTPQREAPVMHHRGLGWFGRFGGSVVEAIAARVLTYWMRDSRYQISLMIIPVVPLLMLMPLTIAGVPPQVIALLPTPVLALFLAWAVHNDVAYDHTAVWLHVAAPTRGWQDRAGRVIPVLLVGMPLVVASAVLCARFHGDWAILPSLAGVGMCILLGGLGLSSIMSARFPYPAVRPGESPFSQPQGGTTAAGAIQALSFIATILISAPAVTIAAIGYREGGWWNWATLAVGVVFGSLCLWGGIVLGGRIFDRRGPELLAFTIRN